MIATFVNPITDRIVIVNGANVFFVEHAGEGKSYIHHSGLEEDILLVKGEPEYVSEQLWGPHGNS